MKRYQLAMAIFSKNARKIMDFKKMGSLILVSHDMNAIKLLCDKVLLLNEGMPGIRG